MSRDILERILDCFALAKHSPDPSTQVGAKMYEISSRTGLEYCLTHAWNSFPLNSAADQSCYSDRQLKYDRIIHAEMRCLLRAGPTEGRLLELYTSMVPCKDCAKHIAEAEVRKVYYPASAMHSDFVKRQAESVLIARTVLAESGVLLIEVPGV